MNDQNLQPYGDYPPEKLECVTFPTGKKEVLFAGLIAIASLALCNFIMEGGFALGFALAAIGSIVCSAVYLLTSGCKPTAYSVSLLALSCVIAAGYARSDDAFVKFVMVFFLFFSINLGLCLLAGNNRRNPGGIRSLLDALRAVFALGVGKLPESCRGLGQAFRKSGSVGQKGGAFLLGLGIAIPVLAVMIPLLISADAAFDGLIALLPDFEIGELIRTVLFGVLLAFWLYTRGVALRHSKKKAAKEKTKKGVSPITVNTALSTVCGLYVVYLISQLAYFSGGFSGILPEGYTMAEYARRGFFEMAWLCAIDLGIIAFGAGLVRGTEKKPLSTRLLCLFIGVVTLFFVATASAKMFLYIDSYGLTRLRVLTQIVMLFLALVTALVMVWLFVPKLPYMKTVLLAGLLIGAATLWIDVDTQVARYNVDAYLSGKLETVDVRYIRQLGSGAVEQLHRLTEGAQDEAVREKAQDYLLTYSLQRGADFRGWNYADHSAAQYLPTIKDEQ